MRTIDGLDLEHIWQESVGATMGVVMCHAHPLHGGTMTSPLMVQIANGLDQAGINVLRFNYRGVGSSEGEWGDGLGEITDAATAVAAASDRWPATSIALVGWSFGAATALRWQARVSSDLPYVGIAPPPGGDLPLPAPAELVPAHRLIIVGDRDQLMEPDTVIDYAKTIGANHETFAGSDHFFYFREQKIVASILDHLTQEQRPGGR